MPNKFYYTWTDIENCCLDIVNKMYADEWRPDYIVGITRGGNVRATNISNMTGIGCEALKVSLRDDNRVSESACWMAEDAFGYPHSDSGGQGKNILIVDDINDSGTTFKVVTDIFKNRRLQHRTAALINKEKTAIQFEEFKSRLKLKEHHLFQKWFNLCLYYFHFIL